MRGLIKRLSVLISVLVVILGLSSCGNNKECIQTPVRDVEITSSQINSETCYKEFDYYQYDLVDEKVVFNGYNTINISDLYDLDLVSNNNIDDSTITTKYICNYDYLNGVVSLSIALVEDEDLEILDTIYGVICMNENLEFDVSFDVEGEIVLLSELSNIEIVENCGFFKKVVKKVKQKVEDTVDNVVDTTKKVLSTTSGKIGTIVTVGACAVAGAVCAVVPGGQVGTAIFFGMAIGYVGGATTAAISTYQQDGEIDWNAVSTYGQLGAIVGGAVSGIAYGVTTAITSASNYVSTCPTGVNCFIEGTIVETIVGNKRIEDIKVGDYVLATDVEGKDTTYKRVKRLFRNETNEWVHLKINGEEIVSTPNHPYYVSEKGWVKASDLSLDDILISSNDEEITIDNIFVEKLLVSETTYNFEVEDYHTYYVGSNSILVHNDCSGIDYNSFSTGRTAPDNLKEQLFMEEVKSNPASGKVLNNITINDPRLEGMDVVKMEKIAETTEGKITIHYLWDKGKNIFFDFKFK